MEVCFMIPMRIRVYENTIYDITKYHMETGYV